MGTTDLASMGRPTGYDRSYVRATSRPDCLVGVGLSTDAGRVTAFLVDLQFAADPSYGSFRQIARFDHNESTQSGHDVRREGLHLDVERRTGQPIRFWPAMVPVPSSLGPVIRACSGYLIRNADFLVDVYEGHREPETAPPWTFHPSPP